MEIRPSSKISEKQKIRKSPELLERVRLLQVSIDELESNIADISSDFEIDVHSIDELPELPDNTDSSPTEINIDYKVPDNIDWNAYNDNHKEGWPKYSDSKDSLTVLDRQIDHSSDNLRYYLMWQLLFAKMNAVEKDISLYIIDNIDINGYMGLTNQELLEDIGKYLPETVNKTLHTFQMTFDPPGIGGKDYKDSLLIQVDRLIPATKLLKSRNETIKTIIRDHLEDLAERRCGDISRKLGISSDEMRDAISVILRLNPRPGRHFTNNYTLESDSLGYVRPSASLHIFDGNIYCDFSDAAMLNLLFFDQDDYFSQLLYSYKSCATSEELDLLKDDLQNKYMKGCDRVKYRYYLMKLFMDELIKEQEAYFLTGDDSQLKPLISKDLTSKIDINESSIRRIRLNKWLNTPYGSKHFNHFFDKVSLTKIDLTKISSKGVKAIILKIIDSENSDKPYTDQEIADILKTEHGIQISKRLVTKYREQLHILPRRMRMKCEI